MSARQRVPLTGRSNISDNLNNSARSSRPESESEVYISTARRKQLNDPLEVFCPFQPEIKDTPCDQVRPPILPKNRYLTVYPEEEPVRKPKPYTPKEFVEKLQAPNIFETLDMSSMCDENLKLKMVRQFVERNKHRLWKFNLDYMNKSPKEVCAMLMDDQALVGRLQTYTKRESSLNLGSSEKVTKNLSDVGYNSLGEIKSDFQLNSLTTSRETRDERRRRLFASNEDHPTRDFVRGFRHTAEYGSFSNYNAYIQLNKSTSINR